MRFISNQTLLYVAVGLLSFIALFIGNVNSFPVSSPEAIVEDMRQIPQWHCLRYRKFDLVKRCRNYRLMRRQ